MANHDEQPQSWRDRLFGENRVEAADTPETLETDTAVPVADEQVGLQADTHEAEAPDAEAYGDELPATDASHEATGPDFIEPEAVESTVVEPEASGPGESDAAATGHEDQQRAWQAAFDGDDSPQTAEYRPSPASAPDPEGDVEPQVVLPSSLRGDNPTGEMEAQEAEAEQSPELVEPARPQLSLRRRARAIEDAKEAERVVHGEEEEPPLGDPSLSDLVKQDASVATSPTSATEPTRVFEAQELGADDHAIQDAVVNEAAQPVVPAAQPAPQPEATQVLPTAAENETDTLSEQQGVQFVEEPEGPRKRGARGTGLWVTVVSTLVFAGLAGLLLALWNNINIGLPPFALDYFVAAWLTPAVIFSTTAFLLAYLLLNLIVNRAGWWAHVLGGFLVALVVYGATALGLNFEYNGGWEAGFREIFTFTRAGVWEAAISPIAIAAFILAREVPIWFGGIVARRGRKQRRRYESELADHREQYGLDEE